MSAVCLSQLIDRASRYAYHRQRRAACADWVRGMGEPEVDGQRTFASLAVRR
jgi:hypothetical protein